MGFRRLCPLSPRSFFRNLPQVENPDTGKPPNLAKKKVEGSPELNQLGGARPGLGRAEYRFWIVLAIGAGAVGSFMAVVVFAVGQYRKV